MGKLIDGWLMLIGILPMPKPAKVKPANWLEIEGKTNYEKLEELNGQNIWANDFHHGVVYGKLRYNSPNTERYYIINSKQEIPFNVHDLNGIGLRTVLD